MSVFRIKPVVVTAITFDDLVQHGRDHGANIVNGMPWSFAYKGRPISHENDDCYLITDGGKTHQVRRDAVVVIDSQGFLSVQSAAVFRTLFEPA